MQNLRLIVFRPPVSDRDRVLFDQTFSLWLKVWRLANAEMEKPTDISSDAFTRQTEIITLFEGAKPVALICLRDCDFDSESTYYDSIFMHPGMWREEDKDVVRKLGGKGMFGSLITVDPDYRGKEGALSLKYLIVQLALARAKQKGAETVVSIIRGKKGLDKVFQGAGCLVIGERRDYGATFADLVTFRPQERGILVPFEYVRAIQDLWSRAEFSEPMTFPAAAKRAQRKAA